MLRIKIPSIIKDQRAIRIVDTRYADDWVILTNSNLKFATDLKLRITLFLKKTLELELSPEKTKITCIKTNYARFLGFTLYSYNKTKLSRSPRTKLLIRTGGYNIKVGIDMDRVISRLELNGFCDKSEKPIAKNSYSVLPTPEIITKYNYMISGSANYFIPLIENYRPFTYIQYILEYSCYGTISKKLNSSIYKIFKKHGKPPVFKIYTKYIDRNQEESVSENQFKITSYLENKRKALSLKDNQAGSSPDIFSPMKKINWRTSKNLNAFCCICGTYENIEWHHVRAIRKGKVTGFTQVMNQLNRKQMPLCRKHHLEVEQGKYNDIKLTELMRVDYWLA